MVKIYDNFIYIISFEFNNLLFKVSYYYYIYFIVGKVEVENDDGYYG